jgi:transcriptional accessory protein Tex/SPT6
MMWTPTISDITNNLNDKGREDRIKFQTLMLQVIFLFYKYIIILI